MKNFGRSSLFVCALALVVSAVACSGGGSDDADTGGAGGSGDEGGGGQEGGATGEGGTGGGDEGGAGGGEGGSAGGGSGGAAVGGTGGGGMGGGMGGAGTAGMGGAMMGGAGGTALFDACPAGMPCKVLLIGDALGAGVASKLMTKNMLTSDNHPNWIIEGNSNAFSTIIPATINTNKPNIVITWFGAENVWNNTNLNQAPAQYLALVDKIVAAAPNALVVVAVPPALDPNWDQAKNNMWNFRAWKFEVAVADGIGERSRAGKHVTLVRMFSLFGGQGVGELPANADANRVNMAVSGQNAVWTDFNKYTLKDSGYMMAGNFINAVIKRHID